MTGLCVTVVTAMVAVVAVTLHNEPKYLPSPRAGAHRPALKADSPARSATHASSPESPRRALEEGQINHMINIMRLSAIRGDEVTQRAMVAGILKHGESARSPLQAALARETNSKAALAVHEALYSLGEP